MGTELILNGEPFTVIGVMPAEFRFPVATGMSRLLLSMLVSGDLGAIGGFGGGVFRFGEPGGAD